MDQKTLNAVLTDIDNINLQDPNQISANSETVPKEWIYGKQMTGWLEKITDSPSAVLQIACRAQHIKRWAIPRADHPEGRSGYKKWRTELAKMHAEVTDKIMESHNLGLEERQQVKDLLQKKRLKVNPETQTLEDVACLVFLEFYLAEFSTKHSEEKLIDIIKKTWIKMSDNGHKHALTINYSENLMNVIKKALSL